MAKSEVVRAAKRAAREATERAPHVQPGDASTLSPSQVAAVVEDSTLGRLRRRYAKLLKNTRLPEDGLKTEEEVRAARRLEATYESLRKRQIKLGLEPLPRDNLVTEAHRLSTAFYRKQRKHELIPAPAG